MKLKIIEALNDTRGWERIQGLDRKTDAGKIVEGLVEAVTNLHESATLGEVMRHAFFADQAISKLQREIGCYLKSTMHQAVIAVERENDSCE